MRLSPAMLFLSIFLSCLAPYAVHAQTMSYAEERAAARRDLQLAKIDFRNYWQIEYPRIRRELDARIRLTEEEIRIYKDRIRIYRPFDRFSIGSTVTLPLQDLRMCQLEAELRLRDLWAERSNFIRFRTADWRELELRVYDARVRVAQIETAAENADVRGNTPAG